MRRYQSRVATACLVLCLAGSARVAKAEITYDFTNPGNMNLEFTTQQFIQPNTSGSSWGPITFIEGSFDPSSGDVFTQDRSFNFTGTLSNGESYTVAAWSFPNSLPMADGTYSTDFTFFLQNGTSTYSNGSLIITGSPGPAAATPEPSSIALLGSGLLGVAGVIRKRVV